MFFWVETYFNYFANVQCKNIDWYFCFAFLVFLAALVTVRHDRQLLKVEQAKVLVILMFDIHTRTHTLFLKNTHPYTNPKTPFQLSSPQSLSYRYLVV